MKLRLDFITNSSSSSYILLLDKPASELTESEVKNMVSKDANITDEMFSILTQSLQEATKCSLATFEKEFGLGSHYYYFIESRLHQLLPTLFQDYRAADNTFDAIAQEFALAISECVKHKQAYTTREYSDDANEFDRLMDYNHILESSPLVLHCSHH